MGKQRTATAGAMPRRHPTSTPASAAQRRWTTPSIVAAGALAFAVALVVGANLGGASAPPAPAPAPPPAQASATVVPHVVRGDAQAATRGMVWVPGGQFLMGSEHAMAQPNEQPTLHVRVHGFWMDATHVTNAQFRAFVDATGYVTTAERKPRWEDLAVQLPPDTPRPPDDALVPGAMVFIGTDNQVDLADYSQWWHFVPGADWRHPQGPASSIEGKDNHPVVQVSYEDALAYAKWVGKRLPTEAEWEYAARGGLEQATYAWGDELTPDGKSMANFWDVERKGHFPVVSPKAGGATGTMRVGAFPPNGYGLSDMTGNAWQWTADLYRSDYFAMQKQRAGDALIDDPHGPADSWDMEDRTTVAGAPRRAIRGGSFLCNVEYCLSYRPSARRGNDPVNPMSHLGFRLVSDAAAPSDDSSTRTASR